MSYWSLGWVAGTDDVNQWIQVDYDYQTNITGVITQGREDSPEWVTSYKIQYRINSTAAWTELPQTYTGNSDQHTIVYNALPVGIIALSVRLLPVTWHGRISLRWDLQGCYTRGRFEVIYLKFSSRFMIYLHWNSLLNRFLRYFTYIRVLGSWFPSRSTTLLKPLKP